MFRRPSPEHLRKRDIGDRFGMVFMLTLLLTFILFPIDFMAPGGEVVVPLAWFFGLPFLFRMFLPSAILGAVLMYATHALLRRITPSWMAFVLACTIAAFGSVVLAYHLDFSLQAPFLSWNAGPGTMAFAASLGGFAAFIAFFLALVLSNIGGET